MLFIVYLILALLALSIIMWVYFDATELGKPAIPWAIAQPMLWWLFFLPLILYAIFREQGQRRSSRPAAPAARRPTSPATFWKKKCASFRLSSAFRQHLLSVRTEP